MKYYCNMHGNRCGDVFIVQDGYELEECIHPLLVPVYKDHEVPSYVKGNWTIGEDGVWSDSYSVPWPDGKPSGPTPDDPTYSGPWPVPEEEVEEPETPEEPS